MTGLRMALLLSILNSEQARTLLMQNNNMNATIWCTFGKGESELSLWEFIKEFLHTNAVPVRTA